MSEEERLEMSARKMAAKAMGNKYHRWILKPTVNPNQIFCATCGTGFPNADFPEQYTREFLTIWNERERIPYHLHGGTPKNDGRLILNKHAIDGQIKHNRQRSSDDGEEYWFTSQTNKPKIDWVARVLQKAGIAYQSGATDEEKRLYAEIARELMVAMGKKFTHMVAGGNSFCNYTREEHPKGHVLPAHRAFTYSSFPKIGRTWKFYKGYGLLYDDPTFDEPMEELGGAHGSRVHSNRVL